MTTRSRSMGAALFKAQCLQVMDRVQEKREEVLITKKGRPVAKLVPVEDEPARDVFGCLAGQMAITADLVASVDTAETWEAS